MNEEWRVIPGFETYEVSNFGRVRKGARIYALTRNTPSGYYRVGLYKQGKQMFLFVHKLVAEAFLERTSPRFVEVDHIDGNKINNAAENLRWVTRSENKKHSYEFPRMERKGKSSPVKMIAGGTVCVFRSMSAAAEATNRTRRAIYNACRDNTRCAGARWERA